MENSGVSETMESFAYLMYCCKDIDRVKSIIDAMQHSKIRIFSDDCCQAMNPTLSEKLDKSDMCIVFLSKNAMCSHFLRSTLTLAIEKNKAIITVFLDKTTLTLCQKLQVARTNIIYATDHLSANEVVNALMSEGMLNKCCDKPSFPKNRFILTRTATEEKIAIDCEEFSIGRSEVMTNHSVTGNSAISRIHAVFKYTENSIVIIDQNSSNKTYLNGKQLVPMVEYPLYNNDEVTLANEKFVFGIC